MAYTAGPDHVSITASQEPCWTASVNTSRLVLSARMSFAPLTSWPVRLRFRVVTSYPSRSAVSTRARLQFLDETQHVTCEFVVAVSERWSSRTAVAARVRHKDVELAFQRPRQR